jgi:hypothetical protein
MSIKQVEDRQPAALGLKDGVIIHGATEYTIYYLKNILKIQELNSEVDSLDCI